MLNFLDLPDEIILKVFYFLTITNEPKDLLSCGQVSKRIRRISHDNSLWLEIYFRDKVVKTEFLEAILSMGCKVLTLFECTILGSLSLHQESQLRLFEWKSCEENIEVLEKLLASCDSLETLILQDMTLTTNMATSICRNAETLEVLHFFDSIGDEISFLKIIKYCQELKDIELASINYEKGFSDNNLKLLANYFPPNVEKLDLLCLHLGDHHVKILLSRCNRIKEINLWATWISADSLKSIAETLNQTLEELSIPEVEDIILFDLVELLKSMPRLKILNCDVQDEEIEFLRKKLPHLKINKE